MDIKLLRTDSRLVHGQVTDSWAGPLDTEAILAASDGAASDRLCKILMLQIGGGKVKARVLGMERAACVYKNPEYETLRAVVVVRTPADVVRLLDLGVEIREANVGGTTFKQDTSQISQAAYVSPADAEALKKIDSRGIRQYIQQVPSIASSDLTRALKERGPL